MRISDIGDLMSGVVSSLMLVLEYGRIIDDMLKTNGTPQSDGTWYTVSTGMNG